MSGQEAGWVEDEAPTTWALVIGIDNYDKPETMQSLAGAAADAVAAVQWLRRLGVPADQILLHAAPSASTKPALDALDVPYSPARSDPVFDSIGKLDAVKTGTRLYVFLSGHGLFEPSSRRLFLLQDAGAGYQLFNLGIDAYSRLFLSWPFRRQFLFMDGCQNYPYSLTRRQQIEAAGPPGFPAAAFTPDPNNSLIACFAASQGQTADEVNGRGALLNRLLPALEPDNPWLWAVDLDFGTGRRTVDLRKLIYHHLQKLVARDTANRSRQRLAASALGAAESEECWPVMSLPDRPSSQLRVGIDPAHAADAVQSLYVEVTDEPRWNLPCRREPGYPIVTPVVAHLPKGMQGRAECTVPVNSDGWCLYQSELRFETSSDKDLAFNLSRPPSPDIPPPGPPGPPGPEPPEPAAYASVKTVGPDGQPEFPLYDYAPVAKALGLSEPHTGYQVAPGVTIIRHENGPEFAGGEDAGLIVAETASAWADVIDKATGPDVAVVTTAWGRSDIVLPPNLHVIMPAGGADGVAGPLSSVPVVTIIPAGRLPDTDRARRHSLRELETTPHLRIEPGPTRIAVTLPWGSWQQTVQVPVIGRVAVSIPSMVGTPPLRVPLAAELGRPGAYLLGTSGLSPLGWIGPSPASTAVPLSPAPSTAAAWALSIPGHVIPDRQATFATLITSSTLTFPLRREWSLAVDLRNRRVEPLSASPEPEWDVLVGLGLIDAVSPERAVELIELPSTEPLLALAAAYVLWSAGEFGALRRSGFEALPMPATLDQTVLVLAIYDHLGDPPSLQPADSSQRPLFPEIIAAVLEPWASRKEVPLLRWGLGLTLSLLDRVPERVHFDLWRSTLLAVEAGLSGTSTWTAHTPQPYVWLDKPFAKSASHDVKFPRLYDPAPAHDTVQYPSAHAT